MTDWILIVEDDPATQQLLEMLLQREGYSTRVVTDGATARAMVQKATPALLITDCFLPKMDGVHLCKFLRADKRFRHLPMVLISGALDPDLLELCRTFGIDAVFKKTSDMQDLVAEVRRLLARRQVA